MATPRDARSHGPADFLAGGGELGERMRSFDWESTPLGPPEHWPRSLKTAVRIMLTSRQPIWLGWGPELTYLYNDPYKSIIGGKHPQALGRPFSEVWSEIWDVVGPMADHVMTQDEGTYVEDQLLIMERHGYPEETYYTFSYSPVPNDEGGRGGLICANTDDTARVIGERQLTLLGELASRTGNARNRVDACAEATRAFKTNERDLPFALIFVEHAETGRLALAGASDGIPDAARDPLYWPCGEVMGSGETRIVELGNDAPLFPSDDWPRKPQRAAVLPIAAAGHPRAAGALVVGLNPYRQFDGSYASFLALASRQVAAALANADAYEAEKARAEALAQLDQAKTLFFSNVSHELRTPLTLMLGPLEDLLGDERQLEARERELLEVAGRNGRRLLKLVNALLDFARIEAGRTQVSYEPTDLGRLTADLASNFRSACERAGIRLNVDTDHAGQGAYVDREMWEKIVLNLVSNAFKFTLEGAIDVRLRETGDSFVLSVSDTGIGIPGDALPKMFERFYRVEGSRGRSHEGTGIGLALVQELVKLHGGRIQVESEAGKGTRFTVTVPRGHAHLPPERVRAMPAGAQGTARADAYVDEAMSWLAADSTLMASGDRPPERRARVLLADDNADLREYAGRLLAEHYTVEAVRDGAEALDAARSDPPDVIVSDVMMPRMDGFELVRELRADPALQTIPVILLSARAGEEARLEGLGQGADDYLVKPFSSRELLVRVAALLQSADIRREATEKIARNAAQFETLFNAAPLGIYVVDSDLKIAAVNPIARPVFGNLPDVIGEPFEKVVRRLWPSAYADEILGWFHHTLSTGEPHIVPERAERRLDRGMTEYYEWRVHRIPLPDNRYGVVCYFRDISALVRSREALEEADRRKDEFIATLSHELRNPLAPLANSLQLLRMKEGDASPTLSRVREIMERQVGVLNRLVDDLLEISRISRGTLELRRRPVDISEVVRNSVETSQPLVESARHRLEVSLPPGPLWVDGDPVRLAQIIANVLNNAAKYTDAGGLIRLGVERREGSVEIRITDNGAGISADELPHIFEMFTRGGARSTKLSQGGLGIGLALAKQLAVLHGGSLSATSAGAGRGSEFTLVLPLVQAAQPDAEHAATLGRTPGKRILVVDDNRDAADSLRMMLAALGADVTAVYDGPAAVQTYQSSRPQLVLLDIGMPGMDGYEVARRIRSLSPDGQPVIVALTGWGQENDRMKSRAAGIDQHLVKPADMNQLERLLRADTPRSETA